MQTEPTTILAGRYALEEELGRSATGMAWRAEDRLLGRTVTVKLIHPDLADDPAFTARLAEESRRLASLSAPGITALLDTGEEDGVPFLVREHVDAVSARKRLEREGPMRPQEAARIAIATLEALAPAHEAGVHHLHLGLDDVLLTPEGGVRVTDLGVGPAVMATRSPEEAARVLGGHDLAPEQRDGGRVDRRADVYAVGALLFELLTGAAPADRRSPRGLRPGLPRSLDRVVARALSPDPAGRFDDASAFATAIRASATADEDEERASRRSWLTTWLVVPVAVALLAAAVIGAGLWLGRLEVGGPLGIRPADQPPAPAPVTQVRSLHPLSVFAFDPFGDGGENDSTAPSAIDEDVTTAWRSENYFDGRLNKPGVGLVFDLGETRRVAGLRLSTPAPGFAFQIAVGDDPVALLGAIGPAITAESDTRVSLDASGRYVLVWITTVVPVSDGHRAEVSDVRVLVDPDA